MNCKEIAEKVILDRMQRTGEDRTTAEQNLVNFIRKIIQQSQDAAKRLKERGYLDKLNCFEITNEILETID